MLLERVNHCQRGVRVEVGLQFGPLLRLEIAAVAAHERELAAVLAGHRIDIAPASQEVVVDGRITWKRSATIRACGKCFFTSAR